MKKIITIGLFIAAFAFSTNSFAQIKLGHVDSNELLKAMPGRDSAQVTLKNYQKELEETYKSMVQEYQTLAEDLQTNANKYSDLIKQTKQKTLMDMQGRIQEFQEDAQKNLAEKEKSLLEPIINKAKKAIEDVAKENKYPYVFDAGVGALLYSDSSDDILPLVKKKLGLK